MEAVFCFLRETQKEKHKSFCHAFYKKRAGVGSAHGREAEEKYRKTERSDKKEDRLTKLTKMRSILERVAFVVGL